LAIAARIRQAWNAFRSSETSGELTPEYGSGPVSYQSPSRAPIRYVYDKTIITSIYTRIAIDVSGVDIRHVMTDEFGRYLEDAKSPLYYCLSLEPNLDQGPSAFRQDIAHTLFDRGCAALVPVDTSVDPKSGGSFDIFSMRVGEVISWYPKHVKVSLYNENKGLREDLILEKRTVAVVENPLFSVMNAPNGTLQRLLRKLTQLDAVDEQAASGKLDLIIQLPYTIKSEARRNAAEKRRADVEFQLSGSKYGIAYADGTEKITQLNRPAENQLLKGVEYLTTMLYGQLGITESIMNGTADEATMVNYYNRTVYPIVKAIVESMRRSFVPAGVITKKEDIQYFRNPFMYVLLKDLAEIADKLTRNEILTSNEIRQGIGFVPSKDPKADQLVNSNMPQPEEPKGVESLDSAKGKPNEV